MLDEGAIEHTDGKARVRGDQPGTAGASITRVKEPALAILFHHQPWSDAARRLIAIVREDKAARRGQVGYCTHSTNEVGAADLPEEERLREQGYKLVKQITCIVRARAGFRVILYGKGRFAFQSDAFNGIIV